MKKIKIISGSSLDGLQENIDNWTEEANVKIYSVSSITGIIGTMSDVYMVSILYSEFPDDFENE